MLDDTTGRGSAHDLAQIIRTSRLRQNAGGFWEIHYSEGRRSKKFSCKTKNAAEAQTELIRWITEARTAADAVSRPHDPTVAELVTMYLTATNNPCSISKGLCEYLGHLRPRDIDDGVINDYLRTRRSVWTGKPMKPGSHRRALGEMRTAIHWGIKRKIVDANDMPVFDMPKNSAPKPLFMRPEQEQTFWDAAQAQGGDLGLFVALCLETAARKSVVIHLTWDRVDFRAGTIDFQDPRKPITRKRNACVPISKRLRPVLTAAHQAAGEPDAGRVLKGYPENEYNRFTRAIGMPWVTPHVMRHTWASNAAAKGIPIYSIARMLGDNVATVEKTYAKILPSDLQSVVDSLGRT